jgi:hypothetical protein
VALGLVVMVAGIGVGSAGAAVLTTVRVSVATSGAQGNHGSGGGLISGDGSMVAFDSAATNLVVRDTNGVQDVFERNLTTGKTTRVSVSTSGIQANGAATVDAISPTGRYVLFSSLATNLVSGDTNHERDVFLRDTVAHTTTRVSVGNHRAQLPGQSVGTSMTPNGRQVIFTYFAVGFRAGCVGTCVLHRDRNNGTTSRVSGMGLSQGAADGLISADGRYVAFVGFPILGPGNLYRRDLTTNKLIHHGLDNVTDDTAISADGNRILYDRQIENGGNFTTNAIIWQVSPNHVIQVSNITTPNTYGVVGGAISANGRYATYATNSPEVAGDTNTKTDVFRRDTLTHTTIRVSVMAGGGQATKSSTGGSMTADGSVVAFSTADPAIVNGDTNAAEDVFLRGSIP